MKTTRMLTYAKDKTMEMCSSGDLPESARHRVADELLDALTGILGGAVTPEWEKELLDTCMKHRRAEYEMFRTPEE